MFECLSDYWKSMGSEIEKNTNKDYYIHKQDKEFFNQNENCKDEPYRLHLELFPEPFNGNIKNPKIVFLFLNPGYNGADKNVKEKISIDVIKAFKQNYTNVDTYPFFWLNPAYNDLNNQCTNWADIKEKGNPGAFYWNKLFDQKSGKSFMRTLYDGYQEPFCEGTRIAIANNYREAREWIAQNVCDIELFPYHSMKFHYSFSFCRSSEVARYNVFKEIEKHPEVLFVLMRSRRQWTCGLKEREELLDKRDFTINKEGNVIINPCPRNPSLNPDKNLGSMIVKYLLPKRFNQNA